ncbi:MAG: sodium:proline symporter [Elusimicrobia bacterium CG_4_9_14_3_um_filter_62_55]|nr:MAG: sodium:proline symporter [Elusimicrobia bacterium CG_4_10_14_0_2_um_filter_63_34]PJB26265.1 MAG: sodium:proline symporter [Elusimicrobia bacterium CG_4_9_14_3_um_filter_62_55]
MSADAVMKFGVVGVYFAALFVIAYYASKRIKDIQDYFIAGKKLNYWIVAFSSRATGESGWLLLGLTGMGFAVGAHAFWVLMGEMIGVVFCWVFLTQRFKALTDRYESITVPDYLESRTEDFGHAIRIVSAVVLVVFVTAYLSAQLTAAGKAFETFLGIPHLWGVFLGLGIILAYTVAGGFVAVAWSDFLQGAMMVGGLTLLPLVALYHVGGIGPLFEGLRAQDPGLIGAWGKDGFGLKAVLSALGLVTIGLGYLGSPQLAVRFIALRDIKEIRQGSVVAALFTLFADGGAVLTGLCGRVVYTALADQETVLPLLVNDFMHPILIGLFISVVLAAIMSTADSLLILASSAVVRDVYQKVLHPEASDASLTNVSRAVTGGLCLFALIFALKGGKLVFWFVLFGWAGITSVFCPAIVLSVFWKRLTRQGVLAGMIVGFVVTVVWNSAPIGWWTAVIPGFEGWLAAHGFSAAKTLSSVLYEIFPAVVASTAATVAVSLRTTPPERAFADLDAIRLEVVDVWR